MDVLSVCPLHATQVLWQPRRGAWALTIVCKATFRLLPMTSSLAETQEFPNEDDNHWNDDPARSLQSPSDMAPFKPNAEVMLVGHAFAPRGEPVARLMARMIVGEVDKSIEAVSDEAFTMEGARREGPRFTKMPLRYERAAGGPETSNPVGVRLDAATQLGVTQLPNLRPPGTTIATRGDYVAVVGFGPIAPSWPTRREKLARLARPWSGDVSEEPLPEGLDAQYFLAAPRDQSLTTLRADERIVLENLHPEHPRLATNLPGIEPRAFVDAAGHPPWELKLTCDTLWIDTDRGLATLTWRAQLQLDGPAQAGRVIVGMERVGRPLSWEQVEPMLRGARGPAPSHADVPADDPTRAGGEVPLPAGLPFAARATPAGPVPPRTLPLPSRNHTAEYVPTDREEGTVPTKGALLAKVGPSWLDPSRAVSGQDAGRPHAPGAPPAPPPPTSNPGHDGARPVAPAPIPPPAGSSPWAATGAPPGISFGLAPPVPPIVAQLPSSPKPAASAAVAATASWLTPRRGGEDEGPDRKKPEIVDRDAARHGVPAASNAAAVASAASSAVPIPAREPLRSAPGARDAGAPTEHVDVIWFDAAEMARIRALIAPLASTTTADAAWLTAEARAPARTEPPEAKDRRDVLKALSSGRALDDAGVSDAIAAAFHDDGSFDPPVVLVTGELLVVFDPVEVLKATVAVTTPFLGPDKKLRETVTAATEALKSELPDAVAEGLTARIEEAFSQGVRAVAAGYVQTSSERILLEGRRLQKKTIFGERRVRTFFSLAAGASPIPAYLPEAVAPRLPIFRRFRARAIVELRPQEDQYEAHKDALVVLALGRALTGRRG